MGDCRLKVFIFLFGLLSTLTFLQTNKVTVVSSMWMIHKEWVLNIFIQHQYPVLTDTYKKKPVQIMKKRIHKKLRVKMLSNQTKISLNIKQFIKSTVCVARSTKRASVAQGFLMWFWVLSNNQYTPGIPKHSSGFAGIP